MAIAVVNSGAAHVIAGGVGVTSANIDSTGANVILLAIASGTGNTVSSIADSAGNTYSLGKFLAAASQEDIWFYYCLNPTTSAIHNFTVTMAASAGCGFGAIAISGGYTGGNPTDQSSNAGAAQPGSVTPSFANEILIAVASCHVGGADVASIDSGFSTPDHFAYNGSQSFSMAYLIETSAVAKNPTWSNTWPGFNSDSAIATFQAGGGPAFIGDDDDNALTYSTRVYW